MCILISSINEHFFRIIHFLDGAVLSRPMVFLSGMVLDVEGILVYYPA
jgi:hypothetical protein